MSQSVLLSLSVSLSVSQSVSLSLSVSLSVSLSLSGSDCRCRCRCRLVGHFREPSHQWSLRFLQDLEVNSTCAAVRKPGFLARARPTIGLALFFYEC